MKKQFLSAVVCVMALAAATPAFAQVGGGIKAGVNLAQISGSDDSPDTRIGTIAGVFLITNQGLIAFQPELLFSMQGAKFTFGTAKADYVQIPLLLRIGSSSKNKASLYGLVGPSLGILVQDDFFEDAVERTDVGATVGAGVTFSRFLVEARFTAGLTDFAKGSNAFKNRVFSVMGGFVF
jgi:hypothetical protein